MEYFKPVSTTIVTGCKLNKEEEYKEMNEYRYRSMIGNLLYVTTSRINIM